MLENVVADARRIAEGGAEQALKQLAVHHSESWPAMTTEEKTLREKLRAHGKQLGDKREASRAQEISRLKQACAYEHWHRMLFARFLAENNLLVHPDYGQPISLDEVKELARDLNADWLSLAASFAQRMLLAVFRPEDPVLQVVLPPETRQSLEEELSKLPTAVFTAEDSLGWVYQFWQAAEKRRVSDSEVKIGADQLSSQTQLFTDDYMVLFLLHNTLGAWWTAKRSREGKDSALPGYEWKYLRVDEKGSPVAGNFEGWPRTARELRLLDPCMGSGHFLIFALPILSLMRAEEEGLTLTDAIGAVLRENLYGLELDARCSQIAAFNVALTAWRLVGQHCTWPTMNLACAGLGINAPEADWLRLAGEDGRARQTMQKLYAMFRQAPTLGSLIDPSRFGKELFSAEFSEVWPLLQEALAAEQTGVDAKELAIAAQGVLSAARILADEFTLVITNVPYLGRGKQDEVLVKYCEDFHSDAKADLATCFVDRCIRFCCKSGSAALVTPQNWLFLTSYRKLRERLLREDQWDFVVRLGEHAFESAAAAGAFAAFVGFTHRQPKADHAFVGWDAVEFNTPQEKASALSTLPPVTVPQRALRNTSGSVISFEAIDSSKLLGHHATCYQGISTGDSPRLVVCFWETDPSDRWQPFQMPPQETLLFTGREHLVDWKTLDAGFESAALRGYEAWGHQGVSIGQLRQLPATVYSGSLFSNSTPVIIPRTIEVLPAIWEFCSSEQFNQQLRRQNQKLSVDNGYVGKIPFDLDHWKQVASKKYPDGLPEPCSSDPTQWLFNGHPLGSDNPLQVAVARIMGYRWPRQTGSSFAGYPALAADGLETHADSNGILSLSSLAGEAPAADRLRAILADAFGSEWSAAKLAGLLGDCDSLEVWLRDHFFAEHCELFQSRPFVWHIWDGRNDGFHALVNYHKLVAPNGEGRKTLERLIYTSLGDWISRQKAEVSSGADGADGRLTAAQHLQSELEKILAGENPYDIFVRWKRIYDQPIGWAPDINDGIRINVRPWLTATLAPTTKPKKDSCVLRVTPNITYGKDRGKESWRDKTDFPWFADSTDRNNDIHLSLNEKRAAQERRKK